MHQPHLKGGTPLALLAHMACLWMPLHTTIPSDVVVAWTDGGTAPAY